MNCRGFEHFVVDMARGERMEPAAQGEAAAHAKTCTRCARRLANEQNLSAVMASAVREDSRRLAPAAVEQTLLAEFRKQHAGSNRQRTWSSRAGVGAIAAALIVAAIVGLRRAPEQPAPPIKQAEARVTLPESPVIATSAAVASKSHGRASQRKAPRKPASELLAAQREVMTDFIPIVYDPEPIERGQIVRIRLPRAALATFGIPVNEEHAEEAIRADVLLGEDGLARAVRFVK